jgi:phage-related protein
LNQPVEFKEFMQYCRSLKFTDDPDYRYILGLFDNCMERNAFDSKTPDFIWNKNRLVLEKEALKQNMMRALQKPAQNTTTKKTPGGEEEEDQGKQQY